MSVSTFNVYQTGMHTKNENYKARIKQADQGSLSEVIFLLCYIASIIIFFFL